jgi:hypothetical protein
MRNRGHYRLRIEATKYKLIKYKHMVLIGGTKANEFICCLNLRFKVSRVKVFFISAIASLNVDFRAEFFFFFIVFFYSRRDASHPEI